MRPSRWPSPTQSGVAFALACEKTIPKLREFMLRRIGGLDSTPALRCWSAPLNKSNDAGEQLSIARGLRNGARWATSS